MIKADSDPGGGKLIAEENAITGMLVGQFVVRGFDEVIFRRNRLESLPQAAQDKPEPLRPEVIRGQAGQIDVPAVACVITSR